MSKHFSFVIVSSDSISTVLRARPYVHKCHDTWHFQSEIHCHKTERAPPIGYKNTLRCLSDSKRESQWLETSRKAGNRVLDEREYGGEGGRGRGEEGREGGGEGREEVAIYVCTHM